MSPSIKLFGLILAAGESSRMGRDKALLPWPPDSPQGSTLLSAAIAVLAPLTTAVIVVAGANAVRISAAAVAAGALIAVNPEPERGQFSSLQTGLRAILEADGNAAAITPVDCPLPSVATLTLLCARFEQALAESKWAVAPEYNGAHGHPLLAGPALIDVFLRAPATANAREVKRAYADRIEYAAATDAWIGVDLNTPEEYSDLASGR